MVLRGEIALAVVSTPVLVHGGGLTHETTRDLLLKLYLEMSLVLLIFVAVMSLLGWLWGLVTDLMSPAFAAGFLAGGFFVGGMCALALWLEPLPGRDRTRAQK